MDPYVTAFHKQTLNIQQPLLNSALSADLPLTCNPLSDPPLEKDAIETLRWEYFNLEVSLHKVALFSIDHM